MWKEAPIRREGISRNLQKEGRKEGRRVGRGGFFRLEKMQTREQEEEGERYAQAMVKIRVRVRVRGRGRGRVLPIFSFEREGGKVRQL